MHEESYYLLLDFIKCHYSNVLLNGINYWEMADLIGKCNLFGCLNVRKKITFIYLVSTEWTEYWQFCLSPVILLKARGHSNIHNEHANDPSNF